jgi:peptide chain release factor 2
MEEITNRASLIKKTILDMMERLDITGLEEEIKLLEAKSKTPDFWQDNLSAQETMKRLSDLDSRVQPWRQLKKSIDEVDEWIQLDDESVQGELVNQLNLAEAEIDSLKGELKYSGPYDDYPVIMSIYAGAGGTDAQDWTQMLLRMYVRWVEKSNMAVEIIDESSGEEAGIKSVTLEVIGSFAYGQLKGEHGVHRLVRLSPFNSDNLIQTSFAKVEVMPKINRPDDIAIDEKDLRIDVFRSGGHGGQSVNTTDSAVRVTHIPTGIVITIQNERSQLQNKETAMTLLRSRLAQLQIEQHQDDLKAIKGPNQSAEWGNQIRSYVLHPYKQVKDLRTKHESSDPVSVLDGNLDDFIAAYLDMQSTL